MINSDAIISLFEEILNEKKCFELAKQSRFIQRSSSKLKGHEFIKAMIVPSDNLSTDSLKGLCKRIRDFNIDADLTSQALCERINNASSIILMKNIYSMILHYMQTKLVSGFTKLEALNQFEAVLIQDSTVAELNEKLQEEFTGTNRGGTGAKAQVKIDLIYDLMRGMIVNAEIHKGNEPDQSLSNKIIKFIKPGFLVIRDLGYFVQKVFKDIIEVGAFFISRLTSHVNIYLNKDDLKPIDLAEHLNKFYVNYSIIDLPEVFIGKEKVPSRLVLYRLPREVVEIKLREANKRARATGRKISKGKKILLEFAAFITNIPKEIVSSEVIGTIYRLRWEVELVFKRWKSQLKIDYLKGTNENRIECLIWSRLSTILIIEIVSGIVTELAHKRGLEISHVRIIGYILRQSRFYRHVSLNQIENFLKDLEQDTSRMLLKDKRVRKTMRERVECNEAYYGTQTSEFQEVA